MDKNSDSRVSLISRWFLRPGMERQGWEALNALARDVEGNEPDTLAYLIHTPYHQDPQLQSLPPGDPTWVEFVEVYRDARAFEKHVKGTVFTGFLQKHGDLFVPADGSPYTTVLFMSLQAGFARADALPPPGR